MSDAPPSLERLDERTERNLSGIRKLEVSHEKTRSDIHRIRGDLDLLLARIHVMRPLWNIIAGAIVAVIAAIAEHYFARK